MTDGRLVRARLRDGRIETCTIEMIYGERCKIVISGVGLEHREFTAGDLFGALIALRLELEAA